MLFAAAIWKASKEHPTCWQLSRSVCVLSYEGVGALRARGFKVRRFQDGFPEWRAAGLPVASGLA
jgi:hypothetical protein